VSDRWAGQGEAGVPIITRSFARLALAVGPGIARLLLGPICAYFFLVKGDQRRASRAFLNRALGRPATWRDVWRNFWTFSQVVLDRVYLLGQEGRGIELLPEAPEVLAEPVDRGQGCLLLGSHLGSFEASRAIKRARPHVPLRLVMDRQQSPAATAFLEALNPEMAGQVLDVGSGDPASSRQPGAGLVLLEALREGALVALLADRPRPHEKTAPVEFLGETAYFPTAPFELALVTQAPLILFWGLHVGRGRYRIVFERLEPPARVPRGERTAAVQACVQRYADRLEVHARAAPYNWFNFYDFWAEAA
jgi:predicted LPLAT superfamily acyltransferase